ncbi:MAG: hypothetical protein JST54_28495 [Deltaproteobacteria bacterium]|nr:hypothetical protein [Deltaproteobacteria bacterium]
MRNKAGWFVLLGLAACAAAPNKDPQRGSSAGAVDAPFIKLERGSCFGTCPVYTLAISSTGSVQFDGQSYVARVGEHTRQLTPDQMKQLRAAVASAQFFLVKPDHRLVRTTDRPTLDLTITEGGQTRHIHVDAAGDEWWPGSIGELASEIDDVADTSEWVQARPHLDRR